MRALVTGAAGFVGANLVRCLLERGHDPIATVRPGGDTWRLDDLEGELMIVPVNLGDAQATERVVTEKRPDVIFHLAAHGAYSWQVDLETMLATNVRCTSALLSGAREVDAAVIHSGSSSEYGYKDHPPREDELVEPNSMYAVTKVAATHLCRLAATTGVRAATLRLYSIYGRWEEPGRLIPTLVHRCLHGGWPPLVGPDTARDFVWVDDACDAFVRAASCELDSDGPVFNIASGVQTTLADIVAAARNVFDVTTQPQWGSMPARDWDTSTWIGDPTAAARILGWAAETSFGDGLHKMASWLREHPELTDRYAPA